MISVVTPSFKQIEWLALALASVADQTGLEVEHIVQDAGTPNIQEAFESFCHAPSRISRAHLYVEKDAGMYDAVNRGLARAQGEVCAYLNCDEQYLPDTLATVEQFFIEHPAIDVLFGDMIVVDKDAQPLCYRRTVLPTLDHTMFVHLNTATCAMFFRRKLIVGGFVFQPEWKAIGDVVWVEQLLRAGTAMATLHEPLAAFTLTGENLGGTSASADELRRWQGNPPFRRLRKLTATILHRGRKTLAGAYRKRKIDIALYTLDSPQQRQRRVAERVGYKWPQEADRDGLPTAPL